MSSNNPSDAPTGAKNIFMLRGPGHSSGEFKVIQDHSENHIAQRPFKDKQSRSDSNKRGKTVKFKSASEEANVMKHHDEPIPKKKKEKGRVIKPIVTKPMQIHQSMDAIIDLVV